MQLYMLIMMQTPVGWRRTKFVEEMPEHNNRDEGRRIAEEWARRTIPFNMAYEPMIAVVVRAAGPHARPQYVTHQTINFDGIRSGEVMKAIKCRYGEYYPDQFKAWDNAGPMMKIGQWDMQVAGALSTSGKAMPSMATKNKVDSVVLPFIDRMIKQ